MIDFLKQMQMSDQRKGRSNGGEDRISTLPDALICQILLNLPTKDAVKTSVLSTRWRSLWLSIPGLDLDEENDFHTNKAFVSFVDRFFDFSVDSPIDKLKITSNRPEDNTLAIESWVDAAVKRKIQHLELNFSNRYTYPLFELLSTSLITCETLVCLRLLGVQLIEFNRVSLPRLKIMHLEEVMFKNGEDLETVIASCPVLEDLSSIRSLNNVLVLRVCSQTIKSLTLFLESTEISDDEDNFRLEVVIDAPRLKYLNLKDYESSSFIINSLCSSAKVDIGVNFCVFGTLDPNDLEKRSIIGNFLTRISNVRDMTICSKTLKVICQFLELEPLPQFCNMSQLHTKIFPADLKLLPGLLESFPNLKCLVLELNGFIKKKEQISLSSVPWCLRSCLERVEMKKPIGGFEVEMKLVRYFLENSAVLKSLTLRLGCPRMQEESIVFMELLRFRRCSSACEVQVIGLEETLMKL